MPRPKAFDADAALQAAITVFWERGYEATSLPDLLEGMGIGRQSLYDTFGDKPALYRAALDAYRAAGQARIDAFLGVDVDPVAGIRGLLGSVADLDPACCARGCMMLNSASDAGRDPEIARLLQRHSAGLATALQATIARGQAAGGIVAGDTAALAHSVLVTFYGLVTAARAGLDRPARRQAVDLAMAALTG